MSADALRQQMTALRRQQRQVRRQAAADRVRAVHRSWWIAAGVIGGLAATAVGCQRVQTAQDRTTIALAELATAPGVVVGAAPVATPQPDGVVNPIANPLEVMQPPLNAQVRWLIGVDASKNNALMPKRSTEVLAALLGQIDLCDTYIGLGENAAIVVSRDPLPGFLPVVSCAVPTTTTAVKR